MNPGSEGPALSYRLMELWNSISGVLEYWSNGENSSAHIWVV